MFYEESLKMLKEKLLEQIFFFLDYGQCGS